MHDAFKNPTFFNYIRQVYCVNRKEFRPFLDQLSTKIDDTLEKFGCDPLQCIFRHGMNTQIEQ